MLNEAFKTNILKFKFYFATAGLISTIMTAIVLALFYRHMAINDIVTLGERNNQVLAKILFTSVKKELIDYLKSANNTHSVSPAQHTPMPPKLNEAMLDIMANAFVVRIKIYNKEGIVVFSTKPSQIGVDQGNSKQFKSAINGQVISKLIFIDTLSIFSTPSEEDNLVQSYLPVRISSTSPIYGVFEIYTDVKLVVDRIERTETIIFFGVFIILLVLYSFLVFIVRISATTIEQQQFIIQERTTTLELLSAQMLNVQEIEKKRMAHKLHEGIAQTLAAAKNNIEIALIKQRDNHPDDDDFPLQQAIYILQDTIQKVRALTMELRPPSLDDFGLIKTMNWLCNEYREVYPDITIKTTFDLDESSLPETIKTLIYRVTQETLEKIARIDAADVVEIKLKGDTNNVSLSLEDNALSYYSSEIPSEQNVLSIAFAAMKERTLLSGGTFSIDRTPEGRTLAKATWEF